jgi:dTDP-4-amino-4,6-dideoxygalactose transaminase
VANRVCEEVLSLPLHPALSDGDVREIAEAVCAFSGSYQRYEYE